MKKRTMSDREVLNRLSDICYFLQCRSDINYTDKDHEAFCRAKEAIETLDKLKGTVYRDETCPYKTKCFEYQGYHCANCNLSPDRQRMLYEKLKR